MQSFKKFLVRELLFTVLVAILAVILFNTVLSQYYIKIFWGLLGLIFILTSIFHYSIIQIQENSAAKFAHRFMMFSGIKMMVYLVVITSYVFIYPAQAKTFLISFFILYLLYTVFEVYLIVRYMKKKHDKNHG